MNNNISRRALLGSTLAALAFPRCLPAQVPEDQSEVDCVFCEIISGAREAAIVWQDKLVVAFGSLHAIQPGHVLVAPRTHAQGLFDLTETVAAHLLPVAARVGRALVSVLGADGLTLLQNNGHASGQSVFHFHMHLIPRHNGQQILKWVADIPRTTLNEREVVLAPVRRALHP